MEAILPTIDLTSRAAKEHIATALLLMKDWQSDGHFNTKVTLIAIGFATALGVKEEFDRLMVQLPLMRVERR